jgi:hypothetical protein
MQEVEEVTKLVCGPTLIADAAATVSVVHDRKMLVVWCVAARTLRTTKEASNPNTKEGIIGGGGGGGGDTVGVFMNDSGDGVDTASAVLRDAIQWLAARSLPRHGARYRQKVCTR